MTKTTKEKPFTQKIIQEKGAVDQSGQIVKVIGYTANSVIPRDERGHLVFAGATEISVEDDNCFAKEMHLLRNDDSTYVKYFIKMGLDGRLFNPWGPFSEGTQADYAKRLGKPKWSFADCSQKCFDFYTKFLQSRNPAWLHNAERELR